MAHSTETWHKVVLSSTAITGVWAAAPLVADAALGEQTLYPGSNNEDVQALQSLLKEKGYFTYEKATGYYGDITTEAVRSFQHQQGLTTDGIAGPKTFEMLFGPQVKTQAEQLHVDMDDISVESDEDEKPFSSLLQAGDEGEKVRKLQLTLKGLGFFSHQVTGHYGRQTHQAVKAFQRERNLQVDGIAGPKTFSALELAREEKRIRTSSDLSMKDKPQPTPENEASSTTNTVMRLGDRGNHISQLQQRLKEAGFYQHTVTGIFGPITEEAVSDFQQRYDLHIDGIVGKKTMNRLENEASQKNQTPTEEAPSYSTLKYQSKGDEVTVLQKKLHQLGFMKMEATGIFGAVTENAIKSFQKAKGLEVDGIVGSKTWHALTEQTDQAVESEKERAENEPENDPSSESPTIDAFTLISDASEHIGVPYVWGGESPSGFDCSGFLQHVFDEQGMNLPRTVAEIYTKGIPVNEPKVGDLVFFETYKPGPSHAGIYVGNGQFLHSGTSTGVTVSKMEDDYWQSRYIGPKRYF